MPDKIRFQFEEALNTAHQLVAEKASGPNELLWGHVVSKAANDEEFRQNLVRNPEETVKKVATTLGVEVEPEQLKEMKKVFSPALPGVDLTKVEDLLFSTFADIREGFQTTVNLAKYLFFAGLAMLVAALVLAAFQRSATWLFGSGGIISVIVSLVVNPLDRIRNAGANLVQIQMSYIAYYNLLDLLGRRRENLSVDETGRYAKELRESASSMVGTLQSVLDNAQKYQYHTIPKAESKGKPESKAKPESKPAEGPKTSPSKRNKASASKRGKKEVEPSAPADAASN